MINVHSDTQVSSCMTAWWRMGHTWIGIEELPKNHLRFYEKFYYKPKRFSDSINETIKVTMSQFDNCVSSSGGKITWLNIYYNRLRNTMNEIYCYCRKRDKNAIKTMLIIPWFMYLCMSQKDEIGREVEFVWCWSALTYIHTHTYCTHIHTYKHTYIHTFLS